MALGEVDAEQLLFWTSLLIQRLLSMGWPTWVRASLTCSPEHPCSCRIFTTEIFVAEHNRRWAAHFLAKVGQASGRLRRATSGGRFHPDFARRFCVWVMSRAPCPGSDGALRQRRAKRYPSAEHYRGERRNRRVIQLSYKAQCNLTFTWDAWPLRRLAQRASFLLQCCQRTAANLPAVAPLISAPTAAWRLTMPCRVATVPLTVSTLLVTTTCCAKSGTIRSFFNSHTYPSEHGNGKSC